MVDTRSTRRRRRIFAGCVTLRAGRHRMQSVCNSQHPASRNFTQPCRELHEWCVHTFVMKYEDYSVASVSRGHALGYMHQKLYALSRKRMIFGEYTLLESMSTAQSA